MNRSFDLKLKLQLSGKARKSAQVLVEMRRLADRFTQQNLIMNQVELALASVGNAGRSAR
jgi:hypothetical protein